METGLLQYKGRVHFSISKDLSSLIARIPASAKRLDVIQQVCSMVDNEIHLGYKIYPINYIAADLLKENAAYADHYTPAECDAFDEYIERQIDKIDVPDLTPADRHFLRKKCLKCMLIRYTTNWRPSNGKTLRACWLFLDDSISGALNYS